MKSKILKSATTALMPAAVLAFTSCSTTPEPEGQGTTTMIAQQGVPGGVIVQTYKITATVTAIDAATRKLTLVTPSGTKTYKAGPEVVNFNQIQVNDIVKVKAAEELAIFLRASGVPASDGSVSAVLLAPIGAKPGGVYANTTEITARVTALDLSHHKATLQFPDGTSKTFKARDDVDLTKVSLGQEVVIRVTEALAITVEKP